MTKEQAAQLKPGMLVKCKINFMNQFTEGKVYTIGGKYYTSSDTDIAVEADDSGQSNGWFSYNFELAYGLDDCIKVMKETLNEVKHRKVV